MAVTFAGCIITQPVHFDEPPNSPPAIYEVTPMPMHALDHVVQLSPMATDGGTTPTIPSQSFDAIVYDADVDQSLQFQVLVDRVNCRTCISNNGILAPSSSLTDRVRRRLTFTVDGALLGTGTSGLCHSVQLLVSGQFVGGAQDPVQDGDLASVTWWIESRTDPSSGPAVDMHTCP